MSEAQEQLGRIEVAPEVLMTIAHLTASRIQGVHKMSPVPAERGRRSRRSSRAEGIALQIKENEQLVFDIYLLMQPHVDVISTSRAIQSAVMEAMNTMVGVKVEAINVHVADVVYGQGQAA